MDREMLEELKTKVEVSVDRLRTAVDELIAEGADADWAAELDEAADTLEELWEAYADAAGA